MASDRSRSLWPWIVATVVAVPVLYVLSIGPVLLLVSTLPNPEAGIEVVGPAFEPLGMLAEHSHPFWVAIRWYVNLWVDFPDFLD
jgi:hypothetical protein